jgi:hypothetical protein
MGLRSWLRGTDLEPETDEHRAIELREPPSADWNWPSRGHKVRPTGDRQPQALQWDRFREQWVR